MSYRSSVAGGAGPAAPRESREITVGVSPAPHRRGRYMARLGESGRVLCKLSTKPFLDAARKLMDMGFDSSITLVMRHIGSETECSRTSIGIAAALTVEETKYGPEFRRWKGISTLAVSRSIAQIQSSAIPSLTSLR